MRIRLFATRNIKEILRDPINLFFGLGFPLVLLLLLSVINANMPAEASNPMFEIANLAPGLAMFGSVFMALFVGMLLAKDRTSSFLMRLFTSPITASQFILGYTAPMMVLTVVQTAITLFAACLFGLPATVNVLISIPMTALTSFLFIGIGLVCGSLMNDRAVGGICGALLTNLAGWLSGVFIPIDLIGGRFKAFTHFLPFYHSVEAVKQVITGDFKAVFPHIGIVVAYAVVTYLIAVFAFNKKMSSDC